MKTGSIHIAGIYRDAEGVKDFIHVMYSNACLVYMQFPDTLQGSRNRRVDMHLQRYPVL